MLLEVAQQVLHSDGISKTDLQIGSLRQQQAEVPNRPRILGDQGVISTGIERNDIAHSDPLFEGIDKWQTTPGSLQGQEYRYHPIWIVAPGVEAGIDNPP